MNGLILFFFATYTRILFLLFSPELNFDRNLKYSIRAFAALRTSINLKIKIYL